VNRHHLVKLLGKGGGLPPLVNQTVTLREVGLVAAEMMLLRPFMKRIAITDRGVLKRLCRLGAESNSAA